MLSPNLAAFISLFTTDADLTLERMTELVASGTQLAVPFAELAAKALDSRFAAVAKQISATASKLAVAAGLFSVALASWTIFDKYHKYQDEGYLDVSDVLDIVGTGTTIVSVGAWLWWTGTGAAAAAGVMAMSTVLSAAVLIVTIGYHVVHDVPGTATYIRACVDSFKDTELAKELINHDPNFRKALTNLESTLDRVQRDLVSLAGQKDKLFTLIAHFSEDGCATILELDPNLVRELLA